MTDIRGAVAKNAARVTRSDIVTKHKLGPVEPDGDYWRASCRGCDWRGDLFDSKAEARSDHGDHVASILAQVLTEENRR